jgi:hypothetical protein
MDTQPKLMLPFIPRAFAQHALNLLKGSSSQRQKKCFFKIATQLGILKTRNLARR